MNLFNWLFKKKTSDKKETPVSDPTKDTDKIKVYDKYGREFYMTKEQWKNEVLIRNLEKAKNNPDALYNLLVGAMQDGFFEEVIEYAKILAEIDPLKSRSATVLGIFYMNCNRLNDAEQLLTDYISTYGENGVVLTNLAKVYSERGNNQKAESILWHALEIDPNQENGLIWYATIQKELGGEPAFFEAFNRVTLLANSWRAQLWLARFAIQGKDINNARKLYKESIEKAGSPLPADLLMQMSGDLGNNGYLREIIELVQPHFQASLHGIEVGNNLIKTHCELNQLDGAFNILNHLYEQKRPDWRETLSYWDTEIAKKGISIKPQKSETAESVTMFTIEGPLWCRDSSPFATFISPKDPASIKISIFGNTTVSDSASENPVLQLANAPGRASRFIPLILSEQISLSTNAECAILIPWMQSKGFMVFGKTYEEKELCQIVEKNEVVPDFVLSVVIDVTSVLWEITVNIIRIIDRISLEKITVNCQPDDIGPIALGLCDKVIKLMTIHSKVTEVYCPDWYVIPEGISSSDYLLRLEQLLAVTCMNQDFLLGGGLNGEHEIIEGILFLNLSHPGNKTVRMLLVQTLTQMKKYKPYVVDSYKEKIMELLKDHPLYGIEGELISKSISDIF